MLSFAIAFLFVGVHCACSDIRSTTCRTTCEPLPSPRRNSRPSFHVKPDRWLLPRALELRPRLPPQWITDLMSSGLLARSSPSALASDDRQPASPHFDGPRIGASSTTIKKEQHPHMHVDIEGATRIARSPQNSTGPGPSTTSNPSAHKLDGNSSNSGKVAARYERTFMSAGRRRTCSGGTVRCTTSQSSSRTWQI